MADHIEAIYSEEWVGGQRGSRKGAILKDRLAGASESRREAWQEPVSLKNQTKPLRGIAEQCPESSKDIVSHELTKRSQIHPANAQQFF
jgi:hypothetical protein